MKRPIYLDHNASTPPDPEVVESMLPWLRETHANPHSSHLAGRHASDAIEKAKHEIAILVGASPNDIIFTSGATEANNLAIRGIVEACGSSARLLHSEIEHKAVVEVGEYLRTQGIAVDALPVDRRGRLRLAEAERAISESSVDLTLVSVMHANNEIGTVQPILELSRLVQSAGGYLHVDAAQTVGKIDVSVETMGIDMLSISGHKLYGPAGIGTLCLSHRVRKMVRPLFFGGGQQSGIRPGTIPVFLVVGFGTACAVAARRMADDAKHVEAVAELFCRRLTEHGVKFEAFECGSDRLPGLRSMRFHGIDGDDLVLRVAPYLSISTGSACSSGELRSSHVLNAIGLNDQEAREVVRLGFGRSTSIDDAEKAAAIVSDAVRDLRETTQCID